jgi:O-antigen/teichoic acid export membrane protein
MSRLLAKDRVTTSVGVVLSLLLIQRMVAFARGIIFARVLGTEQYGIYTLSFFLIPILVIVASLGIPSAFGRFIPRYEQKGAVRFFLRKTYTITVALAIAVAAAIVLAPGFFSNLLYGDPSHTKIITLAGFCIPLMLVFRNVSSTYLGLRLFRASSVFELLQVAVYAVVGTVLVFLFRSATSAIFAYAVSFVLGLVLFVPVLASYMAKKEPFFRPLDEQDFYRHILRFSIWFMVTPILAQVFHYVDRLSLQRLMTSSDQGIYSATVAIAQMISAVGLAVNNVIYPHLSAIWEMGRREEALRHLDLAIRVTAMVLLVLGLVVVLLGDFIVALLLGEAYAGGARVLPYLVVFYLLTISVWLFGVFPSLIEKTYVATIGLVIALPVNIALNLALIPSMGIVGAAMATMLSYFLMWIIVVVVCHKLGMRVGPRTVLVSLVPFTLLLPAPWSAALVLVFAVLGLATPLIFTADERVLARDEVLRFMRRARGGPGGPPEAPQEPSGGQTVDNEARYR